MVLTKQQQHSNRIIKRVSQAQALATADKDYESMQGIPRSPHRRFAVVLAATVLLRLVVAYWMRHVPFRSDANDYVQMAHQLASGQHVLPYWPPGLPLYLTPFVAAGWNDLALRFTMLLFWILLAWALYRMMRTLGLQAVAWVVLLIFSLLPDSIELSIEPLTQLPVAALLLVSLSAMTQIIRTGSLRDYFLLSVSLGCASLVRPSALVLIVLLPACCFVSGRQLGLALITVVLAALPPIAWLAYVHYSTGHYVFNTANAANFYYGNNPWTPAYKTWFFGSHAKLGSPEIKQYPDFEATLSRVQALPQDEQPRIFGQLASTEIHHDFGRFLLRTLNRVRCFFAFDTFTGAGLAKVRVARLPLAVPTLLLESLTYLSLMLNATFWIMQVSRSFWRDRVFIWILLVCFFYAIPYWFSMSHPTYNFPIILPIAILGAAAWNAGSATPVRARTWVALVGFLLIQVEWVMRMSR